MKRPSIFSKHYEKEIKKRRKIISLLIIIPIIGLIIFFKTGFSGLINTGVSMKNGINGILFNKSKENTKDKVAEVQKKSEKVVKQQQKSQTVTTADTTKAKMDAKNGTFIVLLSDGQKISVEYNVQSAVKSIKGVSNSKDISYDISPSKKAIVIQSTKNQDLLYYDVNNISKDITKKTHISSKNVIFPKENKLKNSPNYIWSILPKFIDEDNVAYVSELPWMNEKAVEYIWKVNLKNNIHTQVKPASGTKITFKNITTKGLEANIDGNVVYVTSLGEIVK